MVYYKLSNYKSRFEEECGGRTCSTHWNDVKCTWHLSLRILEKVLSIV